MNRLNCLRNDEGLGFWQFLNALNFKEKNAYLYMKQLYILEENKTITS